MNEKSLWTHAAESLWIIPWTLQCVDIRLETSGSVGQTCSIVSANCTVAFVLGAAGFSFLPFVCPQFARYTAQYLLTGKRITVCLSLSLCLSNFFPLNFLLLKWHMLSFSCHYAAPQLWWFFFFAFFICHSFKCATYLITEVIVMDFRRQKC